MGHKAHHLLVMVAYLLCPLWVFLTERLRTIDKIWLVIISFLMLNKQKLLDNQFSPKLLQIHKCIELKWLVACSEKYCNLWLISCCLISQWEDFEWLSSGIEPRPGPCHHCNIQSHYINQFDQHYRECCLLRFAAACL